MSTTKTIVIVLAILAAVSLAWWLISPLWRNAKLDEPLPQSSAPSPLQAPTPAAIKDNLTTMDPTTKERFRKATEIMATHVMLGNDAMPSVPTSQLPTIVSQAPMVARAHDVEGKALLIEVNGQKTLRFENLKTINGPDLRIYLSAGLNVDDALDLGPIRATQGNVNYTLPTAADTAKYRNALIWCRAFGVLFSYAQL